MIITDRNCCRRQRGKPRTHQTEIRSLRDCSLIASRLMSKSSTRIDHDLHRQKVKFLGHFSFWDTSVLVEVFLFLICVETYLMTKYADGGKLGHICLIVRDLKMHSLCITVMCNEYNWPTGTSGSDALHCFYQNR